MAYHSLTTTIHSSNFNLPSSGQEVTARLSARKVFVTWGGTELKIPWWGTLQCLQWLFALPADAKRAIGFLHLKMTI
jgi:hypothetical protein